jgi:hypothetical protein
VTWQPFPLPDGSYSDATRSFSHQDVVNLLPTPAEAAGTRSAMKYPPVPGLQVFAAVGDGPHRGARDVEGKLFVVSGNGLYQVATDGAATLLGTIPGTGRVSMTHNQVAGGNQLVIGTVDNSYVYDTTDGTLAATGVPLQSVDFLGQMVLGIEPQRRFWRYSALADAKSWSSLDNESAESSPDRIVGGIVSQGEWLVFGERTIEVFTNTPNESTAFQRGAVIERGCANANTLCRLDNSVFFVDAGGIPCRLQGYTPVPIAPKAIIQEIASGDPRKLFAYTWEDNGYVVYYVTAQDGRTWGYDVTSQRWHRRESFGLNRWRLNTLFKWRGEWYGGDYQNGKLYKLVWGYMYEGCEIMPRRLRNGVLHNNGNRVTVHGVRLTVEAGGAESEGCATAIAGLTVTGDLPGGTVGDTGTYQYTSSGGAFPHTFSILSGSLPPGATMDAAGLVTYTYTTIGEYSWTVKVTDAAGNTATVADTASITAEWWNPADATNQPTYAAVITNETRDFSTSNTSPNGEAIECRGMISHEVRGAETGLRYFEIEVLTQDAAMGTNGMLAGILSLSEALTGSTNYGPEESAYGLSPAGPQELLVIGGVAGSATPLVAVGDVLGVLVDLATGWVWFSINGVYITWSGNVMSPGNYPEYAGTSFLALSAGTYAPYGQITAPVGGAVYGGLRLRHYGIELDNLPDGALAWAA